MYTYTYLHMHAASIVVNIRLFYLSHGQVSVFFPDISRLVVTVPLWI